jgi:hypothetical protein
VHSFICLYACNWHRWFIGLFSCLLLTIRAFLFINLHIFIRSNVYEHAVFSLLYFFFFRFWIALFVRLAILIVIFAWVDQPSSQPSNQPSSQPSSQPSRQPSVHPSGKANIIFEFCYDVVVLDVAKYFLFLKTNFHFSCFCGTVLRCIAIFLLLLLSASLCYHIA